MSEKIYEYKTDTDWYVAQWSREYGMVNSFEHHRDVYELLRPFEIVTGEEVGGVNLHIIRHQSDFHLLSFVAKIVAEHTGRQLEVQTRAGAVLLMEGDRLLYVSLPEGGIPVQDFLGSSKQTLLIATRNEGKTREFRAIFEKMGYEVENLNAYPDLPEVAETGVTFEENARLKAETISQLTGKMVLADDSGLKVDILGGMPGVWSARFAGVGASDLENNAKLLHELAMVFDKKDRSAQFHTTLVVAAPGKDSLVVEADWPGYIAFQAKGENGFGYDPLFLIGETDQTSAELSLEEKNSQSHRAQAVKKLVEVFPAWQSKPSS